MSMSVVLADPCGGHSANGNSHNNNNHRQADAEDLLDPYASDHPRCSKRPCRMSSSPYDNKNRSYPPMDSSMNHDRSMRMTSDCYEQVMEEGSWNSATNELHQNWFHDIPTLSKHRPADSSQSCYTSSAIPVSRDELYSLEHQLQQVKRRFEPAAERCAQAVQDYRYHHHRSTTNPSHEFELARRACNPMEILGETRPGGLNHQLFLNRSAIKLANMDALLNFSLTTPVRGLQNNPMEHQQDQHRQQHNQDFFFADLCAAPGGFSEYLLRRYCRNLSYQRQQQQQPQVAAGSCRGFGMSLVGANEQGRGTPWKLSQGPMLLMDNNQNDDIRQTTRRNHGVFYHICHGQDGTGDIFQWQNVQALQREIAAQQIALPTRGKVALVVADGGVDAQRNVEDQGAQTQKLVVCQVAAALSLLQLGGRFILKLLGCGGATAAVAANQNRPTVLQCVMQELYDSFETIQFLKPISSRPASAERYLVCRGFLGVSCSSSIMTDPHNHPVFYGPKWISKVLLGGGGGAGAYRIAPELAAFLARFDRDMMQLNLKACFAILSHLEAKTMQLTNRNNGNIHEGEMLLMNNRSNNSNENAMDEDEEDEENCEAWIAQGYQHCHRGNDVKVNVEQYRIAWRLF